MNDDALIASYATRLGDNSLVLGQRMIELVAAGPELEEAPEFLGDAGRRGDAAGGHGRIRIRAVQEMTPGQALSFVFSLRSIVRDVIPEDWVQ